MRHVIAMDFRTLRLKMEEKQNGLKLRRTAQLLVHVDGVNLLGKNINII
jgi:hypothetical protein